jgi:hypothetical protein
LRSNYLKILLIWMTSTNWQHIQSQIVPSSLLLLFKTNDLMRVINHDLGSTPLNVFGTTLRYCLRSINEYRKQTRTTTFNFELHTFFILVHILIFLTLV